MRVVSVVGARPQFIKLAPIDWELRARNHEHLILHTGQHYDDAMSAAFFQELEIADPTWNLHVGSGSHAAQTAAMLIGCEDAFLKSAPDWVLCYGDTNSTVAAALAATKIHQSIAHVEAGLRSFNRAMPEEQNRVVTDHLCDLLLAPVPEAMDHLDNEGLLHRAVMVGDVMADAIRRVRESAAVKTDSGGHFVATIHRAENTDDESTLRGIMSALASLPHAVHLYAHPRLVAKSQEFGITLQTGSIEVRQPASYRTLMEDIRSSSGVVTDSGGLQKEAYMLGTPCTTVRAETEWADTLAHGWNVLTDAARLVETAVRARPSEAPIADLYGDGRAATRIVDQLGN